MCKGIGVDRNLHRYWVKVAAEGRPSLSQFGVTAFSEADALAILAHVVFNAEAMPEVLEVRGDVDVRDLDQGHVLPNMAPPNWRGSGTRWGSTQASAKDRASRRSSRERFS